MPAVAVVAGAFTAAGAAAGAAALVGGTITMATVASGLAFVGGVATALGGLTGNKKLMKFGMITGLAGAAVGGIASLANSASDAAASATTLSAGDTGLGLSAKAAGEGLQAVDTGLSGIGIQAAEQGSGLLGSGNTLANLDTGVSTMVAETSAANANIASLAPKAPVSYGLSDPSAINTAANNFAPNASSAMSDAASQLRLPQAAAGDGGAFGNFGQFLQKNSELVKVGTGMLTGLGQASMQKSQMEWQQRMDAERRARINASILGQKSNY